MGSSWEQLNDPTEARVSALIIFRRFGLIRKFIMVGLFSQLTLDASRQTEVQLSDLLLWHQGTASPACFQLYNTPGIRVGQGGSVRTLDVNKI